MAQIKIERKRTSLGWLWVLIVLIIIAIIAWFVIGRTGATTSNAAPTTAAPSSLTVPATGSGPTPLAAA